MKITLNEQKPERKLVALLGKDGGLLLPFDNMSTSIRRTVCFGNCSDKTALLKWSYRTMESSTNDPSFTKIYEGDSVTIQF